MHIGSLQRSKGFLWVNDYLGTYVVTHVSNERVFANIVYEFLAARFSNDLSSFTSFTIGTRDIKGSL